MARTKRNFKGCCYCGARVATQREFGRVFHRAYCPTCLERIRYSGVVDFPSYPTPDEARRAKAPTARAYYLLVG